MPKVLKTIDHNNVHYGYYFHCPGCEHGHIVWTEVAASNGAKWTFNEDVDSPTFRASLLNKHPFKGVEQICHLFVTDGKIEYLNDCTHKLAGQTVEMEDKKINYGRW